MEWPGWWSGEAVADMVSTGEGRGAGWLVLAYLLLVAPIYLSFTHATARRRFWCPASGRDVEVAFEMRGIPGFRRAVAVTCCSAFEPATAVHCDRRCLNRDFRLISRPPVGPALGA